MFSKEQIVNTIEAKGLDWVSIESGESPYADEVILVLDKGVADSLYDGLGRKKHAVCVLGDKPKFGGSLVAVKKVTTGWWSSPVYVDKGHKVYVYRVKIGATENPGEGYRVMREVHDRQTAMNAGADLSLVFQGTKYYNTIYLVDDQVAQVVDIGL